MNTYLGGRGLGIRLLYDLIPPRIDPFGPENWVFMGAGPFAGTFLPGTARTIFMSKSPLGQIGWSNAGGHFAAELKYAGYDGILFSGQSPELIYTLILPNNVEFHSASHVKEELVGKAYDRICKDLPATDYEAFLIGPAGEHQVKYASILSAGRHRYRAGGRTGIGAVMGSKNLKAVLVRGEGNVTLADPELFGAAISDFYEIIAQDGATKVFQQYGSAKLVTGLSYNGNLITRNFQSGVFEHEKEINEIALDQRLLKRKSCFSCIHMCTGTTQAKNGPYAGTVTRKPDFETLGMMGSNLGEGSIDAIIKYEDLIDNLGMDSISLGGSLAFAQELWQRGILTEEDTDGLNLDWGNTSAIVESIDAIAFRRTSLGDILADGVRDAANQLWAPFSIGMWASIIGGLFLIPLMSFSRETGLGLPEKTLKILTKPQDDHTKEKR